MNECATNNGGCAHICTDTEGSFTCSCRSGFELASNGLDCNGEEGKEGGWVAFVDRTTTAYFIQVFLITRGRVEENI